MLQVMSFIEIRNSIGPNTVPCVAPESKLFEDELWSCILWVFFIFSVVNISLYNWKGF